MIALSVPVAMAAAVTAYVGVYHLWLHLRRPRRADLYFALTCACMTSYDASAVFVYDSSSFSDSVFWQRLQIASVLGMGMPLLLLVSEQAGVTLQRWGLACLSVFPLLSLTALTERLGWFLSSTPFRKTIHSPWGDFQIIEATPGPLMLVGEALVPFMIGYCLWAGLGAVRRVEGVWQRTARFSSPLVTASACLLFAIMHDMLVFRSILAHPYILEYAWLGVMMVMSWKLSNEVLEAAQTRETLFETERRVTTTLDAIQDAVITTDLEGRITHMNPAAEKMLAVRLWDVLDSPLSDYVEITSPETHSVVSDPVRFAVGRPPNPYGRLPQLVTTDGNERHIDLGGTPLKNPQGRVEGAIVVFRDLTLQHHALDTLQHAKKMESMGQLAGGAAHDLNNLLTPIMSYVELVQREIPKDSRSAKFLEHVQDAAQRAAGLTRQLLALSRKQVLDVQVVPLAEFVRQTAPIIERLVGEKVKVELQLESNTGRVRVDPGQLEQVLLNLATNARDSLEEGGKIVLRTRSLNEGEASLEVIDDGRGMTADVVERIFEPFFTTKPRGKGTGLGLASVRGIVEQHGGSIHVDSEPGEGTSFEIVLPTTVADQPRSSTRSLAPSDLARGSEKVLVAEDDPAVRSLIHDALSQLGYTVYCADGLTVAQEIASTEELDLLLTDVVLPGADGPRIRDAVLEHQKIPVLFMTGHADDRLGERGFVSRGTEVLRKPFTVQELGERVRQVLDHAAAKKK